MPLRNSLLPRRNVAISASAAALFAALACATPANAQSSAVMKQCSERWNDMKAKDQTGDLTYRQFFQQCTANASPAPASTPASKPAASAGPATGGASAKECAARWNDMKARDQTGDLTYRQFSQSCMAGTAAAPKAATTGSRTSVPSAGAKPIQADKPAAKPVATSRSATPAREADSESDKAALTRCNAQWKDYKAKNNLTGAKAWHVFMAKCL